MHHLCQKVCYPNRKLAAAAMRDYNKTHTKQAKSVYKCPYHIGSWHFTTLSKADSKQDRKYHVAKANELRPKFKRKNNH